MVVANSIEDFQKVLDSGKVRDFRSFEYKNISEMVFYDSRNLSNINVFFKSSHTELLSVTQHCTLFSAGFPEASQRYIIFGYRCELLMYKYFLRPDMLANQHAISMSPHVFIIEHLHFVFSACCKFLKQTSFWLWKRIVQMPKTRLKVRFFQLLTMYLLRYSLIELSV